MDELGFDAMLGEDISTLVDICSANVYAVSANGLKTPQRRLQNRNLT
jgi:hypothetical protein